MYFTLFTLYDTKYLQNIYFSERISVMYNINNTFTAKPKQNESNFVCLCRFLINVFYHRYIDYFNNF